MTEYRLKVNTMHFTINSIIASQQKFEQVKIVAILVTGFCFVTYMYTISVSYDVLQTYL